MANPRALALLACLCLSFSLGAGAARADGFRFGGWRLGVPYFGAPQFGPNFAGPRYDGPRPYEPEPLPDETDGMPQGPHAIPSRAPPPPGPAPGGPHKCYTAAETRERVASEKLREPFALMRKASALTQSEALAGKLCRWNDQDIYEISLLRRDGLLIHVFVNAATGQVLEDLKAR